MMRKLYFRVNGSHYKILSDLTTWNKELCQSAIDLLLEITTTLSFVYKVLFALEMCNNSCMRGTVENTNAYTSFVFLDFIKFVLNLTLRVL